jgi:hypothetical protein
VAEHPGTNRWAVQYRVGLADMIWAAVQVAKPGYVVTSGKTVGLFTGEFKGHIFSLFFIFLEMWFNAPQVC